MTNKKKMVSVEEYVLFTLLKKEADVMCNLWITHGGRINNSCLSEELTEFSYGKVCLVVSRRRHP